MARYLVTVQVKKNPDHDPHNKQFGTCPVNQLKACSDSTGSHHTYLAEAKNMTDAMKDAEMKHGNVTRVESLDTY